MRLGRNFKSLSSLWIYSHPKLQRSQVLPVCFSSFFLLSGINADTYIHHAFVDFKKIRREGESGIFCVVTEPQLLREDAVEKF